MYVQVAFFDSNVNQRLRINCESINQTIVSLKESVKKEAHLSPENKLRLFFDGKELQDKWTLFEYGIKVNNVIQLVIQSKNLELESASDSDSGIGSSTSGNPSPLSEIIAHSDDENSSQVDKVLKQVSCTNFYKVGEFVNALHPDLGAYFEAKIVKIVELEPSTSNSRSHNFSYYVQFLKSSLCDTLARSLDHIHPPSFRKIKFHEIQVNQLVLANINLNEDGQLGYWYKCLVTQKTNNRGSKKLRATLLLSDGVTIKNKTFSWTSNEVYLLEENLEVAQRGEELEKVIRQGLPLRETPHECDKCQDDVKKRCRKCSCIECGGKDSPDKQLICDECGKTYHLWCLPVPLKEVPSDEEDWFCPGCKNNDGELIKHKEELFLKTKAKSSEKKGKWGRGLSCTGRTRTPSVSHKKSHFGPIPGVEVGSWWRFRYQASEVGVHLPLVAGIQGKENEGASSIVFNCSYEDDMDLGNEIYYTGSGGKDSDESKCRVGGVQTKDQELKRCNKALAMSCCAPFNDKHGANAKDRWREGKPIRVLRSGNARGSSKRSKYLPIIGVRYDGIYKVVRYWSERNRLGLLIWRFFLRRDDPQPAPWTREGKTRSKKLGLDLINPDGWIEKTSVIGGKLGGKRKSSEDHNGSKKVAKTVGCLSPQIMDLIKNDKLNQKLWETLLCIADKSYTAFREKLEENFRCPCCLFTVSEPVTTFCSHNICEVCFAHALKSQVDKCPVCRQPLQRNSKLPTVNEPLKLILNRFYCETSQSDVL